jgi:Cellulose binding domain
VTEPPTTPAIPPERWTGTGSRIRGRAVIMLGIAIGLVFGLAWWGLAVRQPRHRSPLSVGPVVLPQINASAGSAPGPAETADVVASPPPLPADAASPTPSTPPPQPAAMATTARPPAADPPPVPARVALTARYVTRPGAVWNVGYVADITVTNTSAAPVAFEVKLDLPPGVDVSDQIWNASVDRRTGLVTFQGGPVAPGQRIVFGFVADKSPALTDPGQFEPASCTVNGSACAR